MATLIDREEIFVARKKSWKALCKLAEGDAGEVILVEALWENQRGVLKRPVQTGFPTDILRQANQISHEAKVIKSIVSNGVLRELPVSIPDLLDINRENSNLAEGEFIILSPAKGLSLTDLAQILRRDPEKRLDSFLPLTYHADPLTQIILEHLHTLPEIPGAILLSTLDTMFRFFESLHSFPKEDNTNDTAGFIWNDVKPEHVFIDLTTGNLTIIDWGNSQRLEKDGITSDRRFTWLDDYNQFITSFGKFLESHAPSLFNTLEWPVEIIRDEPYQSALKALKEKIHAEFKQFESALHELSEREKTILKAKEGPYLDKVRMLIKIQKEILSKGGRPSYQANSRFIDRLSDQVLESGQIKNLFELSKLAQNLALVSSRKWSAINRMCDLPLEKDLTIRLARMAISEEWDELLSEMATHTILIPLHEHDSTLIPDIRILASNNEALPIDPYTSLIRTSLALKDKKIRITEEFKELDETIDNVDEMLLEWRTSQPAPPNSGLSYDRLLLIIEKIQRVVPQASEELGKSLELPLTALGNFYQHYEILDFQSAAHALRQLMVFDPFRARIATAYQLLNEIPLWLSEIANGPAKDESVISFASRLEVKGREFRRVLGSANWLDTTISALGKLRSKEEPISVLKISQTTRQLFSWILDLDPERPIIPNGMHFDLGRKPFAIPGFNRRIQSHENITLIKALDNWIPEAKGSSARVFLTELKPESGKQLKSAVKILHPQNIDYGLPLFIEEVKILSLLQNVPGVNPMIECGFFMFDQEEKAYFSTDNPLHESRTISPTQAIRFGLDTTHRFQVEIKERISQGWLPYITTIYHPSERNLLFLADIGYTRGQFMPILQALQIGIQICDILIAIHNRNIVYRDHKILHYYWHTESNGVFLIDWNIAKLESENLSSEEIHFDLVQFGARTLHHMLTGRPAPGALPLGPTTVQEIESAQKTYPVEWRYDDRRIPGSIKNMLEKLLNGEFTNPVELREQMLQNFNELSELIVPTK